ncbi:LamG-like jellyroll fold domain-containing protein [Ornithinibacillus sp. FSL M8-0202]|uniref:LamG-like jellyroll fold domain-containing protein n=1 Tax=Ornithinibacillus sp. FSL M8-0202 TaxID=2921616 RepID=UPI0030D61EB4
MSSELSHNISWLRKKCGLTQEQLAKRLGVSNQAVSKWENGQSFPDMLLLPQLSDIFGVSIDTFFGRAERYIDLRKDLVLEYLFEGDVQDSSGNNRHGRLEGALFCKDRFGLEGRALYFDGEDDYVVINAPPALSEKEFSISLWCYYDAQTSFDGWHSAIISQDGQKQNRIFQLSTKDEYMTFHRFLLDPDLSMNKKIIKEYWYHVVITYKDQRFYKYVNGELVAEKEGQFTPHHHEPIYIGRKSTDEPYFFFHGRIDDIRIYNRTINNAEVNALFLEQGWKPGPLQQLEMAEERIPALECVDAVRMILPRTELQKAVKWYKSLLNFKSLVEEDYFVILSLYKGPVLVIDGADGDLVEQNRYAPFVFKTKHEMEELHAQLASAGATNLLVRDEGFAIFLDFKDPFGQHWMIMSENR